MTLVDRVSAYFLGALAVVLAVCSALFYGVVRRQMLQQYDEQLYGALHSLVAAVEIEPEDVNWQPLEHIIGLGAGDGPDEVQWLVAADNGRVVESSRNATESFITRGQSLVHEASDEVRDIVAAAGGGRRYLSQRLAASAPNSEGRELDEFDALTIVVGRSTSAFNARLAQLAAVAALLPAGGWLATAAVGRQLCRRALRPVVDMARDARSMSGANFQQRLTVGDSGDELHDLGVSFNTLLDRLQRSFDAQRRFTGDAAHELRTPLTVLLGQIEVALRKPRTSEEYQQTLGLLRDEAGELQQVLEALLFLARADEDSSPPEARTVSLAEALSDYRQRWDDHPRHADLRVAIDQPATVVASPPLLHRLLDNLVGNALKYSPAGSPVRISLDRTSRSAVVSVSDQGSGIAPEELPNVFDPFYRSPAARSSGIAGTGLGLAIAERIARALQGQLTCESTPGRGTTFFLRLPLATAHSEVNFNSASSKAYSSGR